MAHWRSSLAVLTVGAAAVALTAGSPAAAGPTDVHPRSVAPWVRHVERHPGGLTSSLAQVLGTGSAQHRTGASPLPLAATPVPGAHDRQISSDSEPPVRQSNPAVAVSLDHPSRAVVVANDAVGASYQIMRTADGGRTWRTMRQGTQLPTGEPCSVFTPSIAYSRRDHAFYLATSCATLAGASVVQLWRSSDDGATWTAPAYAAQAASNVDAATGVPDTSLFYSWDQVSVDNSPGSPHYGRVYLVWSRYHILDSGVSDYCPAQVAYTDHVAAVPSDTTFSLDQIGPDGGTPGGVGVWTSAWTRVAVRPDGTVLALYAQEGCNTGVDDHVRVARSTDGGATFGFPATVDRPGQFTDNPDPGDVLPDKTAALGIAPAIAVSPTSGTVAVTYQNSVDSARSGADIWVSTSGDGRRWTGRPLSTDDQGAAAPRDQFLSALTADQQGRFWSVWLDDRRDPANHLVDAYEAFSVDNGQRWRERRISSRSYDPDHTASSGSSLGVVTGIAASAAAVYPVWPDARDNGFYRTGIGDLDIFTDVEAR